MILAISSIISLFTKIEPINACSASILEGNLISFDNVFIFKLSIGIGIYPIKTNVIKTKVINAFFDLWRIFIF